MSEEKKPVPTEKPVFTECRGGLEFFVSIPKDLKGKWIEKVPHSYNNSKKCYVFSMRDLSTVETNLGLQPGASKLRDPKRNFKITFEATVFEEKGFEAINEFLSEHGFTWKGQTRRFVGELSQLDAVKEKIVKE